MNKFLPTSYCTVKYSSSKIDRQEDQSLAWHSAVHTPLQQRTDHEVITHANALAPRVITSGSIPGWSWMDF